MIIPILISLLHSTSLVSTDSAEVAKTIHRFHAALETADSATALSLLDPAVVILEAGGAEDLTRYRAHHLPADIEFAQAVKSERSAIRVQVKGDVAWAWTTSMTKGTFKDRAVDSFGAELMTLMRTPGGWRITSVHWSSQRRPAGAQVAPRRDTTTVVQAIVAPRSPLPTEAASAGVTRFSFIAYGDTRGRRDGINEQYEHSLVVESMLRTIKSMAGGPDPVRFVLQSGDAVVNGRDPRQWNVSFVGLINRITTEGGIPYFLAPGNHDVTAAANLADAGRKIGLENYLRAVADLIPSDRNARRLAGYPTFAFGYGNTFVVALDSNIANDSTQYAWVRAQLDGLDRARYKHIVAFFHHPAFSSGPHGASVVESATAAIRQRYMPLFREYGVDLLLTGHDHLYDHWVERYRDAKGMWHRMDQLVSGGGGAPLYAYSGEPDLRSYVSAAVNDSVRVQHLARPGMQPGDNPYHYVVVHVDGERIWLEVIGVDWGRNFQPYKSARAVLSDN